MSPTLLSLLCLVQVWPSSSQFVFEVELVSVDVIGEDVCDVDIQPIDGRSRCEPVLEIFCLRKGRDTQSNNITDCPLGRNDTQVIAFTGMNVVTNMEDFNTGPGLPEGAVTRRIMSQEPWPGTFQFYIKAREVDPPPFPIAHLDDIFINSALEVNTNFTGTERYNGTSIFLNRTIVDVRFRVMCQQNYYGADCTIFCEDQNDDVNGYYTCNSDGSIQCREGFRNPSSNCTEAITACDSSPCANGGSCTPMEPFNFTCQCVVGYTGCSCEVNIDDCVSATCPNNSMCVDGVNTFECICLSGFEDIDNDCVPVSVLQTANTGTVEIGVGVGVALVAILVIIIIVVLVVVVFKQRTKKPYNLHQGQQPHELEEKFAPTDAVYATPSSPEATVHKLDNPVYGDDEYDVNVRDFQNPVYGDAADDSAQQDELYTTPQAPQAMSLGMGGDGPEYDYATNPGQGPTAPQAPQAMSLGMGEDGPEYDYATNPGQAASSPQAPQTMSLGMGEDGPEYDYATNPGQGAVTVQVKTNGATHAAHEYTVMDESKRKKMEVNEMEPYEQLHHGIDPPDFVRLAEVEGAGYGSLS